MSTTFRFEYVTSTASLIGGAGQHGDAIGVAVVNDSATNETTRAVIYHNTGAGAVVTTDSGNVTVVPTWQWSLGFTATQGGEYWVRIQTSSEFLVPHVSFERFQNGIWVPVLHYRPGDFAAFELTRKRIW